MIVKYLGTESITINARGRDITLAQNDLVQVDEKTYKYLPVDGVTFEYIDKPIGEMDVQDLSLTGQVLNISGGDGVDLSVISGVSEIKKSTVEITSAELLALNTTPKQLVAAPGAGKAIVPLMVVVRMDYNSAAYGTNTDLEIRFDDAAAGDGAGAEITGGSFDAILLATADTVAYQTVQTADETNATLDKGISAVVATGDPVTGDSNVTVDIYYRELSVPTVVYA